MLQTFRRGAQSWVAKALFGVLLISFAVWGIGPIFRGGGRFHTAAQAGSVKISATEADQAYMQQVRQMEQQYGISLTPELIAQLGIKQQTLQRMVMQSLYDQEANKLGLRLGTELVRQTIAAQPNFRNAQGQFDPNLFHQLLGQVGMSEDTYVKTVKDDIVRLMLMGSVRGSAQPSDTLARTVYAWKNEQRVVDMIEVKGADMTGVPSPSDDDLAKYLADHGSKFMAPEYRAISYVTIDLAKQAQAADVSADDIRKAYDADPQSYSTPESRDVMQITTPDEALAKTIATEAASKSLEDVAKAHNLTARPITGITHAGVMPELADKIFALQLNKASEAIQSPMGWHVMVLTKVTPAVTRSFDQVKGEIETNLRTQKGQEMVYEITRKLQDALAGGATIEEAGKQLSLPVTTIAATTMDGYKPDGSKVGTDAVLPAVLRSAYQQQQGQPSEVREIPSGAFAVVVNSITPAQVKPLADVKGDVKTAWLADKRLEMATAKANDMAEKLRNGTAISGMAHSEPLDRDGTNRGHLPQTAIAHIFASKVGDVMTATADNSVWLIKLTAIKPASLQGVDLAATRTELKDQMSNDLLEQFGTALRTSYGVKINDGWLQQQSADASNN